MAVTDTTDIISQSLWPLKLLCAWPKRPIWPLLFLPTLFWFCGEIGFVLTANMDAILMLEFVRQFYSVVVVFSKTFLIVHFARKIHEVQEIIKSDLDNLDELVPQNANKAEARDLKYAKKTVVCVKWFYIVVFSLISANPLIEYVLVPTESRSYMLFVGPEDILVKTDAGFLALAIPWALHNFTVANGGFAFDSYFAASSHYLSAKSFVLSETLQDIGRRMRESAQRIHTAVPVIATKSIFLEAESEADRSIHHKESVRPSACSQEVERLFYAEILRCVKYHQNICRLRDDYEEIFSTGLFFTISLIVVNMGLAATKLVMMEPGETAFIVTAIIFMWFCFQLVYFCSWGNKASLRDVAAAAYSVYTAGLCSSRIKQSLLMIIIRAQRPLLLTGWGFFKVDYRTFVSALDISYKLLTFALNMR